MFHIDRFQIAQPTRLPSAVLVERAGVHYLAIFTAERIARFATDDGVGNFVTEQLFNVVRRIWAPFSPRHERFFSAADFIPKIAPADNPHGAITADSDDLVNRRFRGLGIGQYPTD